MSACSPKAPAVVVAPAPTPSQRLASADALVRAGCLDCLISAYGEYQLLRAVPSATDTATAGAVRSAALIAIREREMGLADEGYGQRARMLLAGAANLPNWLATLLDVIEVLPASGAGVTRTPTSDIDLERSRVLRTNRDAWNAKLRELARDRRAWRLRVAVVRVRHQRRAEPPARRAVRTGRHVSRCAARRVQACGLPRHRTRPASRADRRRSAVRGGPLLPGAVCRRSAEAGRSRPPVRAGLRVAIALADAHAVDRERRHHRRRNSSAR